MVRIHLAWEGCAVYEILRDDHDLQHIWGFTSKRLWRFSGYYLQIIPRGDWEHWKKKYVIVPADRIWYLGIPSVLGGRGKYKNILRRLEKFDHFGPEFWRQDLKQGVQSKNFDFQRYVRNTDIYYRKVTKTWGWNCRDWSRERTTDFYSFYKMVNFSWAQAILREHVINELNQLFVRLEIECEIKVSGLPTASDIMEVRTELLAGSISFGNVSDRVSL